MAIMFGLAVLGIAAFLAIMGMFTAVIVPTIPDVLTDVPTLYDYDDSGQRITNFEFALNPDEVDFTVSDIQSQIEELQNQMSASVKNNDWDTYSSLSDQVNALNQELSNLDFDGFNQPNQRLELYWFFAYPSIIALFLFIMFAGATYYWEKSFSIFRKGTSLEIIKNSIIGLVVIILLPEFWDIGAIYMKQLSMYLLDPFGGNPEITVTRLWCKMGCIVNIDEVLDQNVWEIALANLSNFGQALLTNAILPLFKAIPVAMLSLSLFIIAKIRVLFIMIVLLTIPLWMVGMNVPFVKKHANDMISNMIGASIAPMFSALTLFVGLTYVDASPTPALEEWVTVLAIGIFASLWPVLLAPKLSIIASQTTGIVQTAIQSSAMMASMATSGFSSGMAQSGALPGMGNTMSKGMQLKTLLAAGVTGAAMGGVQQITPMNIPGPSQQGVTNAMNKGLGESAVSGQVSQINSTNPILTDPQISNGVMHNPGNTLAGMHGMDSGNKILNNNQQMDGILQSQTSHLAQPQQISAQNSLRQSYEHNPSELAKFAR